MHFLPEFDVKVLKDKCLLQTNPANDKPPNTPSTRVGADEEESKSPNSRSPNTRPSLDHSEPPSAGSY